MTTAVLTANSFPSLSERAVAVIAAARDGYAIVMRRVSNLKMWLWIFGIATLLAFVVDVAIGVVFSTALITNQREELTFWDHVIRGLAALAMVGTFLGVVAGVYTTFNRKLETGKRVMAFVATMVLIAAAVTIAAATGYAQLGTLLSQLWNGASAATGMAIDPSMQAAPPADPPLWFRLMSSGMFIGVAFFAAICEMAWFMTRSKLDDTREMCDHHRGILDQYSRYESKRAQFNKGIEDLKNVQDPSYRHARGVAAVTQRIVGFRAAVEAKRPKPMNPASVDKSVWDRHLVDAQKTDNLLESADVMSNDIPRLLSTVGLFFPSISTPSPAPAPVMPMVVSAAPIAPASSFVPHSLLTQTT